MRLRPPEQERLHIHAAARVARARPDRGLRLNHPEATALVAAFPVRLGDTNQLVEVERDLAR
ncbi:MAG: urease subunit gamma, partial [Pseudonocardiales bacterium]